MAKGRDRYQAKQQALASLGRELSRRARNVCELSGEKTSLKVVEVAGGPEEPEADWAVLVSEAVADAIGGGKLDPQAMRYLETAMWSELRPVQIAAVRLLDRLAADGVQWAREARDGLYLDEAVAELI